MDIVNFILACIGGGFVGYNLTKFIFPRLIGEVLNYTAKNGKTYRVLRRPKESSGDAIKRLREKVLKDRGFN